MTDTNEQLGWAVQRLRDGQRRKVTFVHGSQSVKSLSTPSRHKAPMSEANAFAEGEARRSPQSPGYS